MNDGNFIRILYSNTLFSLNGIYLLFTLNDILCGKYYNKYKCSFNINKHVELMEKMKVIEYNLLHKISFKNKTPVYKIYEQFMNGFIKIFQEVHNTNAQFILKISGIWENDKNYGLTYKFTYVSL
jgi:hypothetical protein